MQVEPLPCMAAEGKQVAIIPDDFTKDLRVELVPNVFPYFYEEVGA